MAASAGVVNRDGLGNDDAFAEVVSRVPAEVRALARHVRQLVYDVLPEIVEVVWLKQGSVGWGTGPKKYSEQFAYLMPFTKHVTLGFYHGAELPDPAGLLPEAGGRQVSGTLSMRSLKIATVVDVERPELRDLIAAAIKHQATEHRRTSP